MKKRLKKFFKSSKTDGEKFLLKMQKQTIIVHAFYMAMVIALISAFVKLIAFKATPPEILSEELIIFIPLMYLIISQLKTGLATAKQMKVRESYPVLILLAGFAGILTALLIFGGFYLYVVIAGVSIIFINALLIALALGLLAAVLFYILIYLVLNHEKQPKAANKGE